MNNKNVKGIIALALVTALSFGVIMGSKALSTDNGETVVKTEPGGEELDVTGAEGIEKAVKTETGYVVTVRTKGYGGDILMNVSFDAAGAIITGVEVVEQSETENVGALIAEADFLNQFKGVAAPVYLPGMKVEETDAGEAAPAEAAVLNDGTYTAAITEPDANGFTEEVVMTVAEGKITEVVWECTDAEGNKKSVLSENGQYTMTEDGLTWKEQAEALGAAIVEGQSLEALGMNEEGKTDTVSGVSIYIGGFASMAEECLAQAAGVEEGAAPEEAAPQNGTKVDAVSGATISSTAAVKGINKAYTFLQTVK